MNNYPLAPGAKTSGTSSDAADEIKDDAKTLRATVLAMLRAPENAMYGLTADEAAVRLGKSILSIRPRFSELNAAGMIEDGKMRRKNHSGKMATVWLASLPGGQSRLF